MSLMRCAWVISLTLGDRGIHGHEVNVITLYRVPPCVTDLATVWS